MPGLRKNSNLADFSISRASHACLAARLRFQNATAFFHTMIPADLLLHAYRSGAFPMATPSGEMPR